MTFTVTASAYGKDRPRTHRVPVGHSVVHEADPLATAHGWYGVTVTASTDKSWFQRFTGHLETGQPSITGA
ncbi:MAG: DUF756 domain-containing protein [Nocardiopsaceae bacterium]|nr:DUF756 domain-containing protein [Nocardiopsaceae bacterium]